VEDLDHDGLAVVDEVHHKDLNQLQLVLVRNQLPALPIGFEGALQLLFVQVYHSLRPNNRVAEVCLSLNAHHVVA
jgi:hypothetical protein